MDENPAAQKQSGSQMKNKKGLGSWGWGCLTTLLGFTACAYFIPNLFTDGIQEFDSKIYSAKSALVNIYKECGYSEAKGGGTRPLFSRAAELPGYSISVGPKCYQVTAKSNDNKLSEFSLSHDIDGKTWRTCLAGEYPYGCYADKDLTVEQEPGKPGYW